MFKLPAVMFLALMAATTGGGATTALAPADPPLLLRQPAASRTQIVFNYGDDLWIVSRAGGDARRLTTASGEETHAAFSPDGSLVAFTGQYDGNLDVYVVPASGGEPRRLTYHPVPEIVAGWTPDGEAILFHSIATSYYGGADQLYTVPVSGGFPSQLPLPSGFQAAYSPDGSHLAYVPHTQWQAAWKRYRGGQTTPIWIADLKDSSIDPVPRDNSNDTNPMWVGDTVYFLSDRNGPVSLFAYDTRTRQVAEVVRNDGLDFKSAGAAPDAIVYEQFGSLHLYDLATRQSHAVPVNVSGDLNAVRPHFVTVAPAGIRAVSLSPTGVRAVMEAWGEIFTVPTDKGDIRNVTRTPAVAERDPAWSPDGRKLAYFSDASGEYGLEIRDQSGLGESKRIDLGTPPSFFYEPVWSPDSGKIAYSDKRLNLWWVDADKGRPVKVDTDLYDGAVFSQAWSPDGKWIAYLKQLPNNLHAVFVYSVEQAKSYQVTDGMSDARHPVFDPNGKYLYFTASTDIGLGASGLDMSSDARPVTRSVYVTVLSRDDPSPLAPESDEENAATKADASGQDGDKNRKNDDDMADKAEAPVVVRIDLDGIGQRILALPIPARNYVRMQTGKSGVLFLSEASEVPPLDGGDGLGPRVDLQKFDLSTRKVDTFVPGVNDFTVSFNGEKLLYRQGFQWIAAETGELPAAGAAGEPKPGEGPLKLENMQVYVEPRAMWNQIYHEVWRIERDFLYDPNHHGLDLDKVEKKYQPYLAGIVSRSGLTYLFEEALGEITIGHMFVGGGEQPQPLSVKGGLLGADYAIENGRYRVTRVFDGENWNPGLQAPLTQPGVNVKAGDYLLSIGGRELRGSDNIYQFFENTAGTQVSVRVGPTPDGKGARDVTVVPVASELNLRRLAWMEGNRRRVDEMTGGRVAYVYVPDTAGAGYTNFNRYYFAQVGKQAAIIDERFNEGGQLADFVIDSLKRPLMNKVTTREGADLSYPGQAIYGPKVMIINEMAGSGGDAMPWYFRKAGIGPLVGKRTWGGLVGIGGYPTLMDGGWVTAPRMAIYGLDGQWEVENRGVAPDFDVELDPQQVRQGHDPQLESAVAIILDLLEKHPLPQPVRPAYPNYHQTDGLGVK